MNKYFYGGEHAAKLIIRYPIIKLANKMHIKSSVPILYTTSSIVNWNVRDKMILNKINEKCRGDQKSNLGPF